MHAFYLAMALGERRGVRVHIFAPGKPLPGGDRHWLRSKRIAIHRINFSAEPTKVPYSDVIKKCLSVYSRVTSEPGFESYGCSVIHGQHFAGVFVGFHLKNRFGVPLVATLHKTPIGRALGETIADMDATYAHLSWLVRWPIDAFVAGSKFFLSELDKHGLSEKTLPIFHGVPVQWLRTRADSGGVRRAREFLGIDRGEELIVCPVRFDTRKTPEDFVMAAGILRRELPRRRMRFLVTGGDQPKLMKLASEHQVRNALILKEVPLELFHAVLRTASICVVPTKREGLGLSVLDAYSGDLGRPVRPHGGHPFRSMPAGVGA